MKRSMNEKKNNKGFTLVELIVVLVILAILAAILVPALLGYIDRAKQQQIVLNAKSCLTAAQAEMSNLYAKDATDITTADADRIFDTADVPDCTALEVGCAEAMEKGKRDGYKITYVYYAEDSKKIYYDGSTWSETEPSAKPSSIYDIFAKKTKTN